MESRFDKDFLQTCRGYPWDLRGNRGGDVQRGDATAAPSVVVVPVPAAAQVPVRAPETPEIPGRRRVYITKEMLAKHGYTDECPACTQLFIGHHNATVAHDGGATLESGKRYWKNAMESRASQEGRKGCGQEA